jgi:hypothetical protein
MTSHAKSKYGFTDSGLPIKAPEGWVIIPEDEWIPQVHREAKEDGYWCSPRRCHSTMTAMSARTWGWVRAYARKVDCTEVMPPDYAKVLVALKKQRENHKWGDVI